MAKKERFNHNYNHCASETCELRKDCAHHMAYLEAKEFGLDNIKILEECEDKELYYTKVRIEKPKVKGS